MKRFSRGLKFAALICGLVIVAGAGQVMAQGKPLKVELPKNGMKFQQTVTVHIKEGILFINPASAEQLLKQDTKKLKYVQNKTLTLSAADAVGQKDGEYLFKIGFSIVALPESELMTYADKDKWQSMIYTLPEFNNRFRVGNKVVGEQRMKFTEKQSNENAIYGREQPVIVTIQLPAGTSSVTLALDDDHVLLQPENYKGSTKSFEIIVKP